MTGFFTLRTVEDTFRIRAYIEKEKPESAVIIGGGFIGLEMAENLAHAGMDTTLLQRSAQVMPPLDYDMACLVHGYIRKKGIRLMTKQAVAGFEEADGKVITKKKKTAARWPQTLSSSLSGLFRDAFG